MTTEYIDLSNIIVPCYAFGILVTLSGSWVMKRKVGSLSSKWLFFSVAALAAWVPAVKLFQLALASTAVAPTAELVRFLEISERVLLFGFILLTLIATVCFLLMAIGLDRPNKSFKPTPLRGAA